MNGRHHLIALVALSSSLLGSAAIAADEPGETSASPPTLSDRLEQFRRDLIGEPGGAERRAAADRDALRDDAGQDAIRPESTARKLTPPNADARQASSNAPSQPSAGAKMTGTPVRPLNTNQPSIVRQPTAIKRQGPAASPQVGKSRPQGTLAPKSMGSPGSAPVRMEVQSARKARASSGGGLIPTKTPPERDVPQPEADDPAPVAEPEPDADEPAQQVESPLPGEQADAEQVPHVARVPHELPTPAAESVETEAEADKTEAAHESGVLFTTQSPILSVQAAGPRTVRIGQEAQFAVKIKNAGAPASNVVVMIDMPADVEVSVAHATSGTVPTRAPDQSTGPLEWKIARLDSRTIETLNLTLIPRKSAPVELGVRYTFAPEASQMTVEVQEPKLEMSITGPDDVAYGQTKAYKLTLSNPGNGDTENVVIGLLPVGRSTDGIASHKLGTLRAGESKSINVELTARQAGSVSIKAQAYADGGLRTEAAQQVLVRRANLQVSVEAPKLTYAGTVGTYQIKVVNSGNSTAENVQVAALLPPDAKYIGSNSGGRFEAQQGRVAWSVGTLQTGAERTLDVQCSLNTPGDNRLQFVATADEDLNAAATANTQVQALADLKIEVRDPQGPVAVGQDSIYEVVVRNRGSAAAENVDLTVFFSEGLEAKSVEGAPHEVATGQVIFKPIASVGAGETLVLKVHTVAERAGNHIFRAELVCQSLDTKLAAEEATLYYGDGAPSASAASEPATSGPSDATPAELPQPADPSAEQPQAVTESDDPPPAP